MAAFFVHHEPAFGIHRGLFNETVLDWRQRGNACRQCRRVVSVELLDISR